MSERGRSQIDVDIAATEAALRKLHAERRAVVRRDNAAIVADFDGGMDTAHISQARGLPYSSVQGILYRAGRTQAGRTAIKAKLQGEGASA